MLLPTMNEWMNEKGEHRTILIFVYERQSCVIFLDHNLIIVKVMFCHGLITMLKVSSLMDLLPRIVSVWDGNFAFVILFVMAILDQNKDHSTCLLEWDFFPKEDFVNVCYFCCHGECTKSEFVVICWFRCCHG